METNNWAQSLCILKTITLSEDDITLCNNFAESQLKGDSKSYYLKKNPNRSLEALKLGISQGKQAEIAWHNCFSKTSPPDFTIYKNNQKSHDADLVSDNYNYHVKNCQIDVKPEYRSWCFRISDPVLKSPTKKDIAALTIQDKTTFYLLSPIPIYLIKNNLEPAQNPNLTKHGAYFFYASTAKKFYDSMPKKDQ